MHAPRLGVRTTPDVRRTAASIISHVARHAALAALLVVLLIAAFAAPRMFDPYNLRSIAEQAAILGVITLGQSLVLLVRGFDLSVGSVAGVMAFALVGFHIGPSDTAPLLAVALGLGAAAFVGAANAWLIVVRRVPPFIATLAMMIVVDGIRLFVTRGEASGNIPSIATSLGRGNTLLIPNSVLVWIVLAIALTAVLRFTYVGRAIYAVGANAEAARLSGVAVGRVVLLAYVLCAMAAGLAGVLLTGYVGYVDQSLGVSNNLNLNSITAAIIGGVAFTGGEGNVAETAAGVLLLVTISNLIVVLGMPVQLQLVAQGSVLLGAVLLQRSQRA